MRSKVVKSAPGGINVLPLYGQGNVNSAHDNVPAKHSRFSFSNSNKKIGLFSVLMIAAVSICSIALTRKSTPVKRDEAKSSIVASPPVSNLPVSEAPVINKEKLARKDWSKLITVSNSNYAYGVIGGINNLSVIFQNKTDYPLEQVTAKITYIKANGKPWKTRYLTVYNLKPHSEDKQMLPKVNRGKSVEVSIHKIVSKKMQFRYEAGKKNLSKDDPYFVQ